MNNKNITRNILLNVNKSVYANSPIIQLFKGEKQGIVRTDDLKNHIYKVAVGVTFDMYEYKTIDELLNDKWIIKLGY